MTHFGINNNPVIYFLLILLFSFNDLAGQSRDEIVMTPFGETLKSKIHYVDRNHFLNVKNGQVQIVNSKTGSIDEVVGETGGKKNASEINEYRDGWNTYAVYGSYLADKPATYFSAKLIVPSPPKAKYRMLYLFNAQMGWDILDNGNHYNHIVQPVLQWGVSAAGGGECWSICNWYVTEKDYFIDSLIYVAPGTLLEGVIRQTDSLNGRYSYNSSFTGYPTGLQVENLPPMQLAYCALESYKADKTEDYPINEKITFYDIHIETDIKNPLTRWLIYHDEQNPNDLGQFTKVINPSSDGGEIEIYFRKRVAFNDYDEIHVYPNPFQDLLHILPRKIKSIEDLTIPDKTITNCKIEVFDSYGRLAKTFFYPTLDFEFDLDLSFLKPGLYHIKFSYNDRSHIFNIIKV